MGCLKEIKHIIRFYSFNGVVPFHVSPKKTTTATFFFLNFHHQPMDLTCRLIAAAHCTCLDARNCSHVWHLYHPIPACMTLGVNKWWWGCLTWMYDSPFNSFGMGYMESQYQIPSLKLKKAPEKERPKPKRKGSSPFATIFQGFAVSFREGSRHHCFTPLPWTSYEQMDGWQLRDWQIVTGNHPSKRKFICAFLSRIVSLTNWTPLLVTLKEFSVEMIESVLEIAWNHYDAMHEGVMKAQLFHC